jgi:hypothetical protein
MPAPSSSSRPDRRQVLGAAGVVAGAAWIAPSVLSADAAGAATVPPAPALVAVGQSSFPPAGPFAFHSADAGDTWTSTGAEPDGDAFALAADGAGHWVAVGSGGSLAWTSGDGTTWTAVPAGSLPAGFAASGLATDGAGTWAAVDNTVDQGYFSLTADGSSWATATIPGTGFDAAAVAHSAAAGRWIAVGPGGAWRSGDAQTWTAAANPLPADWNAVAVAADPTGLFVAVGPGSAGTGGAWSTTDGDTWVAAAMPPVGLPQGVAVGPGGWAAVGRVNPAPDLTGRSWTSADGSTWATSSVLPIDTVGFGVATDGLGRWVAVGNGTRSWVSTTDGARWDPASTPVTCIGMAVAFDRLLG